MSFVVCKFSGFSINLDSHAHPLSISLLRCRSWNSHFQVNADLKPKYTPSTSISTGGWSHSRLVPGSTTLTTYSLSERPRGIIEGETRILVASMRFSKVPTVGQICDSVHMKKPLKNSIGEVLADGGKLR